MARPPLPIGAHGSIAISHEGPSRYKARARFRDSNGSTRPVARFGQTKGEARQRLLADLLTMRDAIRDSAISPDTTIAHLADTWLAQGEAGDEWSTGTAQVYGYVIKNQVKPYLGSVRVGEATPAVISAALSKVMAVGSPGTAKTMKTVLAGMMRLAVQGGAINANPARDTVRISRKRRNPPKALTVGQVEELTDKLRSDPIALERYDLPDLVEWMLGTGARIGEACAARRGVLIEAAGTWEVNATLIRVRGLGLVIQPRPKTDAGWRVLALPSHLIVMLERRATEERFDGPHGVVFPSPRAHALRDPSNTSRALREALDRAGFGWVTSHTFRKTVATRLDEAGCSARVIADQLGHSKPSMTQDVYMGRNVVSAEAARLLDR